jgi:hypothetical protein
MGRAFARSFQQRILFSCGFEIQQLNKTLPKDAERRFPSVGITFLLTREVSRCPAALVNPHLAVGVCLRSNEAQDTFERETGAILGGGRATGKHKLVALQHTAAWTTARIRL